MEFKTSNLINLQVLKDFKDRIWSIDIHPSNKYLIFATAGSDKEVNIYYIKDVENFNNSSSINVHNILSIKNNHTRTIRYVKWDRSGTYIAAASFDSTVSIFFINDIELQIDNINNLYNKIDKELTKSHKNNINDNKNLFLKYKLFTILKGHENEVKSISWSSNNNYLATCSRDKTIWIWSLDEDTNEFYCFSICENHTQDVKCVLFHPKNNNVLFSSSYDNTIKIWILSVDEEDWCCVKTIDNIHLNTIWYMNIKLIDTNENQLYLYSCSEDCSISKIFISLEMDSNNTVNYNLVESNKNSHLYPVYSISYDNNLIVSGGGDNKINIYSANNLELKDSFYNIHNNDVNVVLLKYISDNRYLILSGSDDNTISINIYNNSNIN